MSSIVITEKTSQAKDVRAAIGSEYGRILPAEGHLLDLEAPADVNPDWAKWSTALLRPDRRYGTKPASGGNKASKLKAIRDALKEVDTVWLATDPDREGQLIGQEVLEHYGFKGRVMRVVFAAQDPKTIRAAFADAKPNSEFANLYASACARRESDQIYNLSLTRTATVTLAGNAKRTVLGVGRVKTPTLAIVCQREREIVNFKPQVYWVVEAIATVASGAFVMRHAPKERMTRKDDADAVAQAAEGFAGPLEVTVEDKTQRPPKLHDLPALQMAASTKFGWTASKTLKVAQALYDGDGKKILTYPRSEVRHLPENAIDDVPALIAGLRVMPPYDCVPLPATPMLREGKSGTFCDAALEGEAHHAIIPNVNTVGELAEIWGRLDEDERKLLDLVIRTYLAQFLPDHEYRSTVAVLNVNEWDFRATGRQTVLPGWKAAFEGPGKPAAGEDAESEDGSQALPALKDGEGARLSEAKAVEKTTKPPPRYSEGSLIYAMRNAWKFVPEEQVKVRERLKESKGIGTPATRGEVIGGLKKQGFIALKGKRLTATEKGLALESALTAADVALTSPVTTAVMEFMLDEVAKGRRTGDDVLDAICGAAERVIERLKANGEAGVDEALKRSEAPPSTAMKQYAKRLAQAKGLKLPKGYATNADVCREFLDEHAPKREQGEGPRPPSEAQVQLAQKIAEEKGVEIEEAALADSKSLSTWIDAQGGGTRAPSEAALAFAQRIAEEKGKNVPEKAMKDARELSRWIDANKGKRRR